MDKKIIIAKVEERYDELERLDRDYIEKKEKLDDYIDGNSLQSLSLVIMLKGLLKIEKEKHHHKQKVIDLIYPLIEEKD